MAALTSSDRPAALERLKEIAADPQVDPDLRTAAQRHHDDLNARDIAEVNAKIAALGGIEEIGGNSLRPMRRTRSSRSRADPRAAPQKIADLKSPLQPPASQSAEFSQTSNAGNMLARHLSNCRAASSPDRAPKKSCGCVVMMRAPPSFTLSMGFRGDQFIGIGSAPADRLRPFNHAPAELPSFAATAARRPSARL